jgi:hypothetical protein
MDVENLMLKFVQLSVKIWLLLDGIHWGRRCYVLGAV